MEDGAAHDIGPDKSLLIVDDDEAFRRRLARAMEKRGFDPVVMAESVAEGLEATRTAPPAFAVIDLRLEDGNGLDV
ncbi:MAG: two-component system response regulator, partial [Rhodobacterales bacterium CG18_big_fil_WC_8_21_14_2_50_71_9]